MFLQQFYLPGPGHASYLVGSEETGEALVFDSCRDVGAHFDAARVQGLRIRHAVGSHGHKDYLSGLTETGQRADVSYGGPWRPVWTMGGAASPPPGCCSVCTKARPGHPAAPARPPSLR